MTLVFLFGQGKCVNGKTHIGRPWQRADVYKRQMWMKHALELTPNLEIHQAEIVRLDVQNGHVCGVCLLYTSSTAGVVHSNRG